MFPRFLPVSFLHHFLWFAAFSMYFSKSFTRLLHFPIVFAPFPLVVIAFSCTFTVFFQHVYCIVIVCSLSGFLHVPTDFAWFVPSIFLWSLSCFPQVSLYFPIHPLRGFSICFVQHFFTTCFLSFSPLSSIGFCTISSGFLHFHTFSIFNINPRVLPDSFIFRSFLHHFLSLLSHFPALSLYFSSMFTASSWFAPSIRSGFLHFPRDFPWFVPSIRSVFVRFPGDFVRFPLIVIMFSCSFIVFSNTSSWSLRPPKRRT